MVEVNFKNIELVDRKDEMRTMQEHLERVASGKGHTLFVSGEAGIGKTRIVEEVIKKAQNYNYRVIRGQCIPENLEPLFPFKSALKRANLEHLLSNKPPPMVISAYLMDSSGLVIAKAERHETNLDPDIFAGMLKAIEAFVKDSMRIMDTEENATLNSLSYGDYNILIQSTGTLSIATVIRGEPNEFLIEDMKRVLANMEKKFADWHGDMEVAEKAQPEIEWFITSKKYDGKYLAGEPSIVQENLFDNLLLGLQRLSERSPLFIFIDDLQWADQTSLNFLYYLSRNTRNNRILIVGTYRPEEIIPSRSGELHPLEITLNNLAMDRSVSVIGLLRLKKEDTMILISRILGDFEERLGEKIFRESGGNPLFVIEIIKLLLNDGNIYHDGTRWKLKPDAERITIPKRAYELIKRRLERLSDEEREILDVASVVGEEFDTVILSLGTGMDELKILKKLNNIYRKHKLIYIYDGKYRFEHSIIREVIYNELIDELRRKYHRIIGDIIYEMNRENIEPVINVLAHHYYEARDKKAIKYLILLGERARKNYANDEALRFYSRALEIVEDKAVRSDILEKMGDIMVDLGNYAIAEEKYKEAMDLSDDDLIKARIKRKIADIYYRKGNYEVAMSILKESEKEIGNRYPIERGRIYKEIGYIKFAMGEYEDALSLFKNALKIFAPSKDTKSDIADILKYVGNIHQQFGDYERARKYYTNALQIAKEFGDMKEMAVVLSKIGDIYLALGDYEKALTIYRSSLKVMQNVGYKFGIATILSNLGNLHFKRGELDVALDYYKQSLEICEKIDQKSVMAGVLNNMAHIMFLMDDMDGAVKTYTRCLKLSREIGDKRTSSHALINIAKIYAIRGNVKYALQMANKAMELIKNVDRVGYVESLITLSEIYVLIKNFDVAKEYADEAIHTAEELGSKDLEMKARRVKGMIHRERKNYRQAVIEFTKALRYFTVSNNEVELARTYYEYGLMWAGKREYKNAKEYLEKAEKLFREHGIKMWARKCREELNTL